MSKRTRVMLLFILFLFLLPVLGAAQLRADTVRGEVGARLRLPLLAAPGAHLDVTGKILLSNPTVFFPERLVTAAGGTNLVRRNDSTYEFSFKAESPGDTAAFLEGLALAGNDSLCRLTFFDLLVNEASVPDFTALVITHSTGTPLPYVRFALLEPTRPTPAPPRTEIMWVYRIDKSSDVQFVIYDMRGREVHSELLREVAPGVRRHSFAAADNELPAGVYWVRLISNSGDFTVPMVIAE